jgi:hypothetical protein
MAEVSGTVHSIDGSPIEGVLVMGAGLNYCETDAHGCFSLLHPEMALFFWCTGFLPKVRVLSAGEQNMDIVLRTASARQQAAH